jgi:predicted MFS family arabinose efflux permease
MLLLRIGVGLGEAGLTTPSHSLLSDYYPPSKRASAIAIQSLGVPLGILFGAILTGWLTDMFSWRVAFFAAGLPGLAVALAVYFVIKEPARGGADPGKIEESPQAGPDEAGRPPIGIFALLRQELVEIKAVAKLFAPWPIATMLVAIVFAGISSYGLSSFIPPYFVRAYGLSYTEVGLVFGIVVGAASGVGTVAGGYIIDRMVKRSARWYLLVPAIALGIASPMFILAFQQSSWWACAVLLIIPNMLQYNFLAPTFAVGQNIVSPRQRATASALILLVVNLISLAWGPFLTGWMIDKIAASRLPGFADHCPGGVAGGSTPADIAALCMPVLADATRIGLSVIALSYAVSAILYFIAARGLPKVMPQQVHEA